MSDKLELLIDRDRMGEITVDDLLAIEERERTLKAKVRIVAAFVVNGNGGYMEAAKAQAAVRQLTVNQLNETFATVLKELNETAVPNG